MLPALLRPLRRHAAAVSAVPVRAWNDSSLHIYPRRAEIERRLNELWNPKPVTEEVLEFDAPLRALSGKKVAKLRAQGITPCLILGRGLPEIMVQIEERKIQAVLAKGGFGERRCLLKVNGFDKPFEVVPKQVLLHPVTDRPQTLTFYRLHDSDPVRQVDKSS